MNSEKRDQSHCEIESDLIIRQQCRDGKMFLFLKPPSSAFPLRKYYNNFYLQHLSEKYLTQFFLLLDSKC